MVWLVILRVSGSVDDGRGPLMWVFAVLCNRPALLSAGLALRTVPVTAGVIGDLDLRAAFTAQHVTTERGTSAALNGRHHFQLAEA